jgi:hypothetical protein
VWAPLLRTPVDAPELHRDGAGGAVSL